MNTVLIGYGIGLGLIGITSFNVYKIMRKSIIINKRDFEKIEKKIRLDERRRVLDIVNIGKNQ